MFDGHILSYLNTSFNSSTVFLIGVTVYETVLDGKYFTFKESRLLVNQ